MLPQFHHKKAHISISFTAIHYLLITSMITWTNTET